MSLCAWLFRRRSLDKLQHQWAVSSDLGISNLNNKVQSIPVCTQWSAVEIMEITSNSTWFTILGFETRGKNMQRRNKQLFFFLNGCNNRRIMRLENRCGRRGDLATVWPTQSGRNDKKKKQHNFTSCFEAGIKRSNQARLPYKGSGGSILQRRISRALLLPRPSVWEERASRAAASQSRFSIQCLIIAI